MKTSWRRFFRRIASVCVVYGATAWSSAVCFAVQLAADNASNAPYADGWQAGDNGGFGFLPWNFDNDTIFAVEGIREIDGPPNQSPFNQLGTAWRLGLNYLPEGKDIVRAGRGLPTPLQVGQTLSMVIDAPTDMDFFDLYTVRLNHGGGNICYGGAGCTSGTAPIPRFAVNIFNWTNPSDWGRWAITDLGHTPLFNTDTDNGMRVDFTLTGTEAFTVTLTPLDNPGMAFTYSGGLEPAQADFDEDADVDGADFLTWQRNLGSMGPTVTHDMGDADGDERVNGADLETWTSQAGLSGGADGFEIDWIEFMFYGNEANPLINTDFYIGSMELNGPAAVPSGDAVPEPSALALAAAAGGLATRALLSQRRKA